MAALPGVLVSRAMAFPLVFVFLRPLGFGRLGQHYQADYSNDAGFQDSGEKNGG
jgi:hypothetical protein